MRKGDDAVDIRIRNAGIISISGSACIGERLGCPDVQVHVVRPGVQFGIVIGAFGQGSHDAIDTVRAVAVRVDGGQTELDFTVGSDLLELRDDQVRIGIQQSEIFVHHAHGVDDLRVADVLLPVVVQDVKDHRNDVDTTLAALLRLVGDPSPGEIFQLRHALSDGWISSNRIL